MDKADIVEENTVLYVSGKINFNNVVALRKLGDQLIRQHPGEVIQFDLSRVEQSDFSGLAAVMAWQRQAMAVNRKVEYSGMPHSLQRIASLCGVQSLLSLSSS